MRHESRGLIVDGALLTSLRRNRTGAIDYVRRNLGGIFDVAQVREQLLLEPWRV